MENDYLIDFFGVEPIPGTNSSAAFVPKTSINFRENAQMQTAITPDGIEYVPWGADDMLPFNIIDLIEQDETLSTCQVFNAEVCYGSGISYCTGAADSSTKLDVESFIDDNALPEYFIGICQDLKHFNFAVSVILLNADASEIVAVHRKEACYCRLAKANAYGSIPYIVYGNFRCKLAQDRFEKIPLLDPRSPYLDLCRQTGREFRANGTKKDSGCRQFAVVTRFPGVDSLYYPIPHYASLFRSSWYDIKRLIGVAKLAKLRNAAPIKYMVEVSQRYWDNIFSAKKAISAADRSKIVKEQKRKMLEFLTNTENSGCALFTGKSQSVDGTNENPDITIKPIDSKTKEGGDWESDIAEAINMVCFTMRVHSNLVGSVPGKSQSNNSGSDKRELYTIAQAMQQPYRDIIARVHRLIIRFNGWQGVHVEFPFIQLTTLDEHQDMKQVTLNNPNKQ